ncbi:MAG: OOP family OmpA-OmpF porin [Flavobacteriaceae bacterium]|jgi:OOP family OmpA-OmpF porin
MKAFIFSLLILIPFIGNTQSRKVWLYHADDYFSHADYHNAMLNYQKALSDSIGLQSMVLPYEVSTSTQRLKNKGTEIDSNRVVPVKDYIEHQIAVCYIRTFDYKQAVAHFSQRDLYTSYPEDLYHLGVAQMNINDYESAIKSFDEYIKSETYSDSLLRSAQLSITGCYYAMDEGNTKSKVIVEMADTNVFNRGTSSFAPMFFESNTRIMFTSAEAGGVIFDPEKQDSKYLCDLYWTEMSNDGSWQPPKNFGRPLNSAQHDASSSLSKRDVMYFTRWNDEDRSEQHIYLARMVDLKFYESFALPESVNLPGYRSINPYVADNGIDLYFSSNRPGGEGGMDLWKIKLDETGNVTGEAVNLGRPINTELDEVAPFYHTVSSVLFFSSNGLNSIGGLDIYKAQYNRRNKGFDAPVNLGLPINSSQDDAYIIWDQMMHKGFFASDRADCETGHCYDIYEITNEPIEIRLEGIAYDLETDEVLPNTTLTFKDIDFTFDNFTILTDDKGFYSKVLDKNQEIFIKATKTSYFADAASVNTKPITESTLLIQDFYLDPIPSDEIELDGIEYDFNSANLRSKSKEILDELYDFLILNNNLIVEINAHTDARGTAKYNKNLAERRAKSCVDYLVKEKGIPANRLVAQGFGEEEPNYLKNAEKKQILGADGERIYLIEAYINAQPLEKTREEYHQRNRRTSFKVIGEGFKMESL